MRQTPPTLPTDLLTSGEQKALYEPEDVLEEPQDQETLERLFQSPMYPF